jgi:hypothetical protein
VDYSTPAENVKGSCLRVCPNFVGGVLFRPMVNHRADQAKPLRAVFEPRRGLAESARRFSVGQEMGKGKVDPAAELPCNFRARRQSRSKLSPLEYVL